MATVVAVGLGGGAFLARRDQERIGPRPGPECPGGRVTASVGTYTTEIVAGGVLGVEPLYEVDVEFEVTNGTTAAVLVREVRAGLLEEPPSVILVGLGSAEPLAPGETATVGARTTADELVPGAPPAPDGTTVQVTAEWADNDLLLACDPPPGGRF